MEIISQPFTIYVPIKNDTIKNDIIISETEFTKEKTNIEKVIEYISGIQDERIILLRIPEVIQWLYGEITFLPEIVKSNKTQDTNKYKLLEDTWGQTTLKLRRPDLTLDKQWTTKFGEHIGEEMYSLLGKHVSKPSKKNHYQPDIEIEDAIIECKTQTYYTTGTAGEKILGCPFKYAEIPRLYGKKLFILCMGGAEKKCREEYGNLSGEKCSPEKKEFIDFFASKQIEFIGATDILYSFLSRS